MFYFSFPGSIITTVEVEHNDQKSCDFYILDMIICLNRQHGILRVELKPLSRQQLLSIYLFNYLFWPFSFYFQALPQSKYLQEMEYNLKNLAILTNSTSYLNKINIICNNRDCSGLDSYCLFNFKVTAVIFKTLYIYQ